MDRFQVTKANKENKKCRCKLNKNIQNLYEENHKVILQVTIDDVPTWKTRFWIEKKNHKNVKKIKTMRRG